MACHWNLDTYTKKVIQIACVLLRLWKLSVRHLAGLSPWSSCLLPRWHQICCSRGRCFQHSPFPGPTRELSWEVGELLLLAPGSPKTVQIVPLTILCWDVVRLSCWSCITVQPGTQASESWRGRGRQLGLCQGGFGVTRLDPIAAVSVRWSRLS